MVKVQCKYCLHESNLTVNFDILQVLLANFMADSRLSTREKLINAASELFLSQGFGATTTRQIADLAQVNETTLFRKFGGKHDLLLAVIEQSGMLTRLHNSLSELITQTSTLTDAVRRYASERLISFDQQSELLRALVGEAGQYSASQQRLLSQSLTQTLREVTSYLALVIEREHVTPRVSPEKLAGMLNAILLGYLMVELTSPSHQLWGDRTSFLDSVVDICLYGAIVAASSDSDNLVSDDIRLVDQSTELRVNDLPGDVVRVILQQAKKQDIQTYAIAYLLFGAGLLPREIVGLERSQHLCTPRQHVIQINEGAVRQVPINQWIMGKRYGSYSNNPLSQWLKSRKDDESALFITDQNQPLSELGLLSKWNELTIDILIPESTHPAIEQAHQTWCVEMLMKGIAPEDLGILSGLTLDQIQPYEKRAREKAALERAIQLDQKST